MNLSDAARDAEILNVGARTQALVVSRSALAIAYEQARGVSRRLHQIEDLSNLDWEEVNDLCRAMHQAETLLRGMLEAGSDGAVNPYINQSSQGENDAKEIVSEEREQWTRRRGHPADDPARRA